MDSESSVAISVIPIFVIVFEETQLSAQLYIIGKKSIGAE
jgi:hypothetical protein